ncbi:hypothetical protein PVAND_003333 [Polypedilum vanderplanki]|nr:hypothetical protein PVAND_003333 [Polypedilum vanderplanki]
MEFLRRLPGEHVKQDLFPILSSEIESYTTKVLGCSWDTIQDCYVFNFDKNIFIKLVKEFEHNPTKRELASTISRIYDVFGFLAHFVIRGKIILQRCWKKKLDWDDKVPDEIGKPWKEWINEFEKVSKLKIPRMFAELNSISEADNIQLHVFCDAGSEAFGTVAYLVVSKNQMTTSHIIMGKAKVTPIKLATKTEIQKMPQLELMAALLAARMGNTISSIYEDLNLKRFFWSDSEVVLRWILNPDHNLVKYARAPIEEILELTKRNEWKYVPTSLNVADECTKFRNLDFSDSKSRWFTGPHFIIQSSENWPQLPEKLCVDYIMMANNVYIKKLNYSTHILPPVSCKFISDEQLDKFSATIKADWGKLVRQTARALKLFLDGFIPTVKAKQLKNQQFLKQLKELNNGFVSLSAADLERAEQFIFRKMQRETFGDDYNSLAAGKLIKNKMFQELNVFMDNQGLIRINSRVNMNKTNFPQQFVPLLPRKNGLMPVLLLYYHYKYKHITIESQIAEIRTKCWIPQIRVAMRKISKCCNVCIFRKAQPYGPAMAQLPKYRIDPDLQPFEVTGVDCMGPIVVKMYGREKKIWIMIFTCTLTRFIDLHILESLESLRVLEAIVCFWCAARLLKEDHENAKNSLIEASKSLSPKLSEIYAVDWEFIPAHSPWFGGFYERLIKEVKRSIQDILSERKIDKIQLNIAIKEAAHRINLRPLTHNAIAAEDAEVLTPHHLAKHRPGWPLLPGMHKGKFGEVSDRSIYRRGRAIADQIVAKFVSLYLPVLTKRTKWLKDSAPLKKDDLVLLIEPNKTRSQWQRGIVTKIYTSGDRKGRVADVKLKDGTIKKARSVRNLARIEISPLPTEL